MSHMNESCHISMSHISMSHVTHQRVISHMFMSQKNEIFRYEWVTSHINHCWRGKDLQHLLGAGKRAFSFFYIFWNSDYRQRFPLKSTEIWRSRKHQFCVLKFPLSPLWLFFQNVIQLQPHGSKNPIVLYQEMWLQRWLHVRGLGTPRTCTKYS